ncbi:MAG: hypothetical protein H7A01_08050 [Hahellaceae bacterium]|nr:hypothetical protein [Hahellaceae bacterium]MCP5211580.1 hypothetical protein [Hahellaceae bacterium]
MYKIFTLITATLLALSLQGCKEDLFPSDKDNRTETIITTVDFVATTTLDEVIDLDALLAEYDAVVLYYTMWCPLCDTHMSYITSAIMPNYPQTAFLMVDYVSGSVSQSRRSQVENGYQALTVIADSDQSLLDQFHATMATTVVISQDKLVLLNEDFKNGARLIDTLNTLGSQ